MSIFTNVAVDSVVTGGLVGGSVFTGVAYESVMHPEIGDTKDYSQTIGNSAEFGIGLALAYLGVKYGSKGLGMLRKPSVASSAPAGATQAQSATLAQLTGVP
jgi:hypothetical protein